MYLHCKLLLKMGRSHTLKNAVLFQPKFGSNMDKPKCWVKNVIKKMTAKSESLSWVKMLTFNCHFLITFLTQHLGLSIFDPNLG